MDALSTTSTPILSTPELPADVILTILENLQGTKKISYLRIVSKQFDALIVPLSYRHVHLTDRIVAPFAFKHELYDPSIAQLQVARDVRNHARHLTVKRNLDWSLVAKVIESLYNLRSFTWAFWGPEAISVHKSANSTIGPALCKRWPNVHLHFGGVRASVYQPSDYTQFPNANLVTCKIAAWKSSQLPMIKELLFERPRLEELHLVLRRRIHSWAQPQIDIHEDQNVQHSPALKRLVIDGYNWNHSPRELCSLWDWSNITHLELRNVQHVNFLRLIPIQRFPRLQTYIEQCTSLHVGSHHKEKSAILCNLVEHTTALEELNVRCDTQISNIVSAIARKGSHLRILNLRCFYLPATPGWMPLGVDQLKTIGSGCPQMMELAVDLSLLTVPHVLRASSGPSSRTARVSVSSIVTRSMKKTQNAKPETNGTDRDHPKDRELGVAKVKQEIPSWYTMAYVKEKYEKPGSVSLYRVNGLNATIIEHGISYDHANDEFMAWKQAHRKEEVAAMRNQICINPAPALAKFRNLRRLTIFTRIYHYVAPEPKGQTYARTSEAVRNWFNELLLTKQGADFEEVVINVVSEVVNEEVYGNLDTLESTYTFTGSRVPSGAAEMREVVGHWSIMKSIRGAT